jgi:phosphatidylinositol alpha 1,6-mannosyltransferase
MISGAALIVQDLAITLANQGCKALVITASDRAQAYTVRDGRLHIERLASRANPARVGQRYLLWPGRAVATALDAFGPDVIHLHEPLLLGWAGLRAARRLGAPVVLTAHQLPWFAAAYAPRLPLARIRPERV